MKKKKYTNRGMALLLGAALSPLLATSCVDDLMENMMQRPLRLSAKAEENLTPAQTRAGLNIQGSNFDAGERIATYIKDSDGNPIADGDGTAYWPALFTTSAADGTTNLNTLTHTPQLYYPIEDKHIIISAFYPSTADVAEQSGTTLKSTTTFTVDADQTGTDGDAKYKASDLMFAYIADQARTIGTVNLNFKHKMVKFIVNVVADGDIDIGDIYLTGVHNTVSFDPTTGAVSSPSGNTDIKLDNGGAVVIPPQVLTGEFIAVHGTARSDGQPTKTNAVARFSLKYEASSGGALTTRTLESGKVYTVNISVGYDNFGATYELGKWDDDAGVISVASYGSSGFSIDNSSLYSDNDYTHDSDSYDYTGSEIRVKPVVKYGATKVLTRGTDYDLQYFNNVHAGKATVLAIGKNAYEGYAVAASYTINQIPSSLQYTETDKTTDKTALSVEYVRNYTINPTAETPKDIHLNINGNGTMSYTVSRVSGDTTTDVDKVATVDGTGVITVKGTGTVLITASMAADKDYLASTDNFTLTVTPRTYDPSTSKIRAYFTEKGVDGGSPTYTYNGKEHKPAVTVEDYIGDTWLDITSNCTITYPDGGINVNGSARVNIVLNAPYQGTIIKTYTIQKATPNLRLYESSQTTANLLSPQTLDLYLGLPNGNSQANLSRVRVGVSDFGEVVFAPKNNAENSICSVTPVSTSVATSVTSGIDNRTTATFAGVGSSPGDIIFTATVVETANYNSASVEFTVHVVTSLYNYSYTGKTQKFTCPATGEYLLEVWGAQGGYADDRFAGNSTISTYAGGSGAHVTGKIKLNKGDVLYANVGQAGQTVDFDHHHPNTASNTFNSSNRFSAYNDPNYNTDNVSAPNISTGFDASAGGTFSNKKVIALGTAWNGGGGQVWGLPHWNTEVAWKVRYSLAGGGGGTDISLDWKGDDTDWRNAAHMLTRIIVGGGGGGAIYYSGGSGYSTGADAGYGSITASGLKGKDGVVKSPLDDSGKGGEINKGGSCGTAQVSTYGHDNRHSKLYDGRPFCFSGSDGIFGEGGYYACPEEGSGCGGGGWYGGGAASQHNGNGAGGGGSSYVWCSGLASYYPTLASLASGSNTAEVEDRYYYYQYKSATAGSIENPSERTYRYIYDASSEKSDLSSEISGEMADGYARITCLSTSNTVDLNERK